ncbi:MAG: type secretion protein [Myxococcales bacterium]|nr:type secretion protein [Myxococcales bacterium]
MRSLSGRYGDLALAVLVIGIVGMMILPLPTAVIDVLLATNIAVAVTLLLTSLYVSDALKIGTFPTLLLLTTLFRLALEVSATRLILTKANAGQVIAAFGHFVVGGNLVVGAVIFLILTLIQFIVITKGAERIAEVAARFTLDAMPGKQLAIDAELRAGHIDAPEAQRRRAALGRESQLFGSMDGAMKFVKGDAIAGVAILAVNIVGGLTIGVLQRGMDVGAAARAYTLLTIGAGLVAQIPALLISTAAGIVVTRVASEEGPSHLGRDIARELLANPKAIAMAAVLLALLALVPGLPALPFLALAVVFGLVAARLWRRSSPLVDETTTAVAGLPGALVAPLAVDAAPALARTLAAPDGPFLAREIPALRRRLFDEAGIVLPAVVVRARPEAERTFVLRLQEAPLGRIQLPATVADGDSDADSDAGASARLVAQNLAALLRRHGHELIGIQETQTLLDDVQRSHPALVREVVPALVAPAVLADVLRRLAQEGISLRALREILGALAASPGGARDAASLTEQVRGALRRTITFQHADQNGRIAALLLDPLIEDTIRDAIHRTPAGNHLALEPQLSRDIRAAIGRALASARGADQTTATAPAPAPVLLTVPEIRPYLRRLVENQEPPVAVLSFLELAPEAEVQTLGHVRV